MSAYTINDLVAVECDQILINAGVPVNIEQETLTETVVSVKINGRKIHAIAPKTAIIVVPGTLDMAGI